MTTPTGLRDLRLQFAGARDLTAPGAGSLLRSQIADATLGRLHELWQAATVDHREPLQVGSGVALACTGSLARGDGGPLSDLDLVLLHDGRSLNRTDLATLADRLWYPLWDSGVGLDHSVRSASQTRQVASDDLAVAAAMLDLRHVAGDEALVGQVARQLGEDWRAQSRKRLPELVRAVHQRHRDTGDLAQSLEPDLKEARGGLRDMVVLRALTRSWLADRPHGDPDRAYARLLDVRDALQLVTGRPRNTVPKEEQQPVADLLGLTDPDELLTETATAARVIAQALDATMRRARQSQQARMRRIGPRRPQLEPVGPGLYLHDEEIVLGRGSELGDPALVLRAAVAAAERAIAVSPVTLDNLRDHATSLSSPWPSTATDLLVALLGSGDGLVEVWEQLDQAGFIERWIPAWTAVRSRPQRNSLHHHTVDRHLVEAVRQAARLEIDPVLRPTLLVAALLHDIGKIRGATDHSLTGAPIARETALALGFTPAVAADTELLVRHHLLLMDLATTRDPDDPTTVAEGLGVVQHRLDLLELLAALSEADARAVGGKAWTPWRATLLNSLVGQLRAALLAGGGGGGGDHRRPERPAADRG